jgi:hypothetical protein
MALVGAGSTAGGAGLGAAGDGRAALGASGVGVDEGLHVGGCFGSLLELGGMGCIGFSKRIDEWTTE